MRERFWPAAFAGVVLAIPLAALGYASLQLSPRSIVLDATHRVGQISMSSLDAHDLIFDLEPVVWTQHGDNDSFSPTRDLIVVPPVYDVQPFRRIVVRVGLREKGSAPAGERAFQVRFREVLPPGSPHDARVVSDPVFVAPAEQSGEVRYELQREGERDAKLIVNDESNVHAYLGKIRVESGDQEVSSASLDEYVLAGNSRTFTLQLKHPLQPGEARLELENAEHSSSSIDVPVR